MKWFLFTVAAFSQEFLIEPEFETVTCGSSIKLAHKSTGFRLHSHEVNYGSGSGQQSVTCFPNGNDPNSYFMIQSSRQTTCQRGTSVRCGQTIVLRHVRTDKLLHSHKVKSPISGQQEVSAYAGEDEGDNWIVGCNTKVWKREVPITLQHKQTKQFLSSSGQHRFSHPINGQLEVAARSSSGPGEQWIAQEGIYLSSE
jgi:dolichyl-phosphate-mannose--protein O-mannosyl transferase